MLACEVVDILVNIATYIISDFGNFLFLCFESYFSSFLFTFHLLRASSQSLQSHIVRVAIMLLKFKLKCGNVSWLPNLNIPFKLLQFSKIALVMNFEGFCMHVLRIKLLGLFSRGKH